MSAPVDLPEHKESGLVSVSIFEDLRYYCRVHSAPLGLRPRHNNLITIESFADPTVKIVDFGLLAQVSKNVLI